MGVERAMIEGPPRPATPRQLALLRRYFRAVTGDQQVGDRLVAGIAPALDVTADDAPALFTAATRAWRRLYKNDGAPAFSARTVGQTLSPARSLARQAGVMVRVFGLTVADAATALNRSPGEVTRLMGEDKRVLDAPLRVRLLIVEDEPMVAQHLAQIARRLGVEDLTIAHDYDEAVTAARAARFDVAICDYDLGRGRNGLDVVRTLSSEHDTTCLFVTAYPDEVLSGSDHEPSFVIAKPFGDEVAAALSYAAARERPVLLEA